MGQTNEGSAQAAMGEDLFDGIHEPVRQDLGGVGLVREPPETKLRGPAADPPEVFDLRPLSRRRTLARISKRGPAEFRFVSQQDE